MSLSLVLALALKYFCITDCCSAESAFTTVMAPVWVLAFPGLENLKFNFLTRFLAATPHILSSLAYRLPLNLLPLLELLANDRD